MNKLISSTSLNGNTGSKRWIWIALQVGKEDLSHPAKCLVLDQPDAKDTPEKLHVDLVLVPADKEANNVTVVFKKYYIETLVKELGINVTINTNSTYIPCADSFDEILKTHANFISSLGLEMFEEDKNLLCLYWTPKLHKTPLTLSGPGGGGGGSEARMAKLTAANQKPLIL